MYRDAVKTTGLEERLVVKDLIELVTRRCSGLGPHAQGRISGRRTMSEKIGVYVCHCGTNIAGVVDVEEVSAWAGQQGTW